MREGNVLVILVDAQNSNIFSLPLGMYPQGLEVRSCASLSAEKLQYSPYLAVIR